MSVKNENSRLISRKIDKAIYEYQLIEPNDRILLAVSGGKDSLTMSYFLGKKQKGFPIPFEAQALYIESDFEGCDASPQMETLLDQWGIPFKRLYVEISGRLKPNEKLNCFWCSTQRRLELMNYATANGFNKIALGHHLDDIIETAFMNMAFKSQLSTMLPKMRYDKYPQTIIRPLARVEVREIVKFASDWGFLEKAVTCPYGKNSKRLHIRSMIDFLAKNEGEHIHENLYNALGNVNFDYLPRRLSDTIQREKNHQNLTKKID